MRTRELGGATVAAVGAGDVSLARAAARGVDAGEVAHALHEALDRGLDVVDVACEDAAERLAGDAVRALRLRDRAVVACRVPALTGGRDVLPERLPPRHVQARVEAALRATRLDPLPLAIVEVRAAWRDSPAWPELRGTCARLGHEGKVMRWGLALDAPDDAAPLVEPEWLAALRVPWSVCERAMDPVIALALERGIAVLAARPLAGGALAGAIGPGVRLAPGDDRRALDPRQLEAIAVGVAKLAALVKREPPAARSCHAARAQLERNPRAERLALTVAELALRAAIDRGAIALPRLHRREHLAEAISAGAAPPLDLDLAALDI